ncbi:HAD-IIA family hydrolase [Paenibacillus sp. CECT 9249]|uniref:HAD-IIA family hydrolase n=1 Tax=unclassified Paenibacillus TaxID=185978 RepID=UPI001C1077BD|nr:HAD-IIA family hydrolase [Paenibacillus sp. CECT 9249]MBU5443710.1 HAD-IIA family hydrolase [Paenibacillus sp. MSJ-34]CAH0117628.1 Sugar-phosphatase AraL [Paenibacillus sp. CECT 9249]
MDHFSGYIFDLDGTIYLGDHAIDGAVETIRRLQQSGKKLLFLTNKTIDSRENYVTKLNKMGINVTLDNLLNPTVVTIHYLQDNYNNAKVYVIGEDMIKEEFKRNGIRFASTPEDTDIVVLSWDRQFHYDHLNFAYQAIKRGAIPIATNPDRTCPVPEGDVPDCGGMIGAVEGTTGKRVETIIGKPSVLMALTALDILQLEAKDCLMVGDRIETDVLMGKQAGMNTALVMTGVTQHEDVASAAVKPDYILDTVFDIVKR